MEKLGESWHSFHLIVTMNWLVSKKFWDPCFFVASASSNFGVSIHPCCQRGIISQSAACLGGTSCWPASVYEGRDFNWSWSNIHFEVWMLERNVNMWWRSIYRQDGICMSIQHCWSFKRIVSNEATIEMLEFNMQTWYPKLFQKDRVWHQIMQGFFNPVITGTRWCCLKRQKAMWRYPVTKQGGECLEDGFLHMQ